MKGPGFQDNDFIRLLDRRSRYRRLRAGSAAFRRFQCDRWNNEAGPDYPDMDSLPSSIKQGLYTSADIIPGDHEWGIYGSPNSHAQPMLVPRGKVVGGSSAVNGQMFLRGIPEDFNNWAAEGNQQWDFDAILPYYKKLERDLNFSDEYHGTSGPIPVWRHSREDWLSPQKAFESACISEGYESCPDHNAPSAYPVDSPRHKM